jgi:hypothetical protein
MQGKKLLPEAKVAERYGVTTVTLWRWDVDPKVDFPKPIRIRGRKYRDVEQLDAFDARQSNDFSPAVAERLATAKKEKQGGDHEPAAP